jgi:hypothetical protein
LPVALAASRAEIFTRPDKSHMGRSRPWIKFSARETEKHKNPNKILIIFDIWKIIQFKLLIGSSAENYIKGENPKLVNFVNENLNSNFLYDNITGGFLRLGPTLELAVTGSSFLKSRAGRGSGRPNLTGSSPLI